MNSAAKINRARPAQENSLSPCELAAGFELGNVLASGGFWKMLELSQTARWKFELVRPSKTDSDESLLKNSRGDRMAIELFTAGVRAMSAELARAVEARATTSV